MDRCLRARCARPSGAYRQRAGGRSDPRRRRARRASGARRRQSARAAPGDRLGARARSRRSAAVDRGMARAARRGARAGRPGGGATRLRGCRRSCPLGAGRLPADHPGRPRARRQYRSKGRRGSARCGAERTTAGAHPAVSPDPGCAGGRRRCRSPLWLAALRALRQDRVAGRSGGRRRCHHDRGRAGTRARRCDHPDRPRHLPREPAHRAAGEPDRARGSEPGRGARERAVRHGHQRRRARSSASSCAAPRPPAKRRLRPAWSSRAAL